MTTTTHDRYVRLRPVTDRDGYTGYEAILVDADWEHDGPDDEPIEDVIRVWPDGVIDAGLVADVRAARWARTLGVRYRG